jgi:hypothetical protein
VGTQQLVYKSPNAEDVLSLFGFVALFPHSTVFPVVWLYIGPDVLMPLTSALAAIAGVLMMFWQRVAGLVGRLIGRRTSEPRETDPR